jgi:glycosyltransferase involved in cell wall biosynthesis
MISNYLPSGSKIGVGYQVHALANAMIERGHSVTVFSACEASEGSLYRTQTLAIAGSNRTFKFALHLRKVDWSSFDVLHAHGDDYWLWRRRVKAHVRTLHGSCFREALTIRGARARLRMTLLGFSEVLASAVADQTVAVSENSRLWMPWVKTVIPNGVDLDRFRPRERTTFPSILFVGTYGRRKRGSLVADAFERDVLPVFPDCELWMVCEDAPPRLGVRSMGRISDDELSDLYGRAWVFCLPSTYEGFGIPYIEAMASGCPVVATENPGAMEVTSNGQLGVIVDDDHLGETLLDLLSSPERRARLASGGLAAARQYEIHSVCSRYEAIYQSLIANTRRTVPR